LTEIGVVLSLGGILVLASLYLRRLERSAAALYWAGSWSALFAAGLLTLSPMGQPWVRAPASFMGVVFAFLLLAGAFEHAGRRAPRALAPVALLAGLARGLPHLLGRSDLAYLLAIPVEVPAILAAAWLVWRAPAGGVRSLPETFLAPALAAVGVLDGWDALARASGAAGTLHTLAWVALMLSVLFLQLGLMLEKARARERALLLELERARKLETLGRLVGGVAHDFNNQLTVILGNARILRETLGNDDEAEPMLADLASAAERCADLTGGLLAFARKTPREPRPVDVSEALDEVGRMLRPLLPEGARLEVDVAAGVPPVLADATQLGRVLSNLAMNARDAIAPGGRVALGAAVRERPGDAPWVELTVRDDGTGMDEETRAHIFDPFFTTKPSAQGTGLGLSIAFGLVESHGGHIEVESAPGRGTRFRVRWPAAREAVKEAPPEAAPVAVGRGETILLAEDERAVRRLTRSALERRGFHVREAQDGQEALEIFRADPDAVAFAVLDWAMPRLDGVATLDALRAQRPGLPALLVSGYPPGAEQTPRADVEVLAKPFTPDALAARVRTRLDAGGNGGPPPRSSNP